MINRSAAFDAALTAGCPAFVAAEIFRGDKAILAVNLEPGAKVHLAELVAARRTFTGQVADDGTLAPHLPTDPLAPYGVELKVYVGLILPDKTTEQVHAGVFRIHVTQADKLGLLTITGVDRSAVVANAQNEKPYTIAANTPLDTAIGTYLNTKYPGLPFTADPAAHGVKTPGTATVYLEGTKSGDPWANMQDLAATQGYELFIDAAGGAVLRVIPTPVNNPVVWDYSPGPSNLHLGGTHTMDTTNVKNVWIAEGAGTGTVPPVSFKVEISDRNSPIFPDPLTFGRRPEIVTSAQVTTAAQAKAMALGMAAKGAQGAEQMVFDAVPHPCHEPGDVVHFESDQMGVDLLVVLSSWDLQLDLLSAPTYTCRLVPPFSALSGSVRPPVVNPGGPVLRGATSASTGTSTSATSVTLTKPTGTALNDIILIYVCQRNIGGPTIPTVSGFTQIAQIVNGSCNYALYYKVAGGAEPATYPVTWTGAETCVAMCVAHSGADTVKILDPIPGSSGNASNGSFSYTGPTTTVNGDMLVWFGAAKTFAQGGTPGAIGTPAGFTVETGMGQKNSAATANMSNCAVMAAARVQTTAGNAGTTTATYSGTSDHNLCSIVVAVAHT